MKRLILGAVMMIGFISFSTAQKVVAPAAATTKPVAKKAMVAKPAKTTTAVAQPVVTKPATKTVAVKPAAATTAKPATAQGVVLKKDGTPDKRYTTTAAKAKGPVKKDGTPDLRYKANKKG